MIEKLRIEKCNILAIETTGKEASVAFINDVGNLISKNSKDEMSHLKNLMPLIDNLLKECKLQIGDLTHIAVSQGPGSFTGIRIGVTTARALAQTLNIKAISVPTLKSFVEAQDLQALQGKSLPILICPIIDARRSQVYGGAFFNEEITREIISDDCYELKLYLEKLTLFLNENQDVIIRFYGDGAISYRETIDLWAERVKKFISKDISITISEEDSLFQSASNCARLALKLFHKGETTDYYNLVPVYLRKAEAEIRLEEKLKGLK